MSGRDWGKDEATADRARLADVLGTDLAGYADTIPHMMAKELVNGDPGFIAAHQLSRALLSRLTPDMRGWTTPDVLRAIYPETALSRTRMQPIAGALSSVICQAFPSFSYYPYLPVGHMAEGRAEAPLIVAVHGSSRNPKDLRDAYAAFAERLGCFVLAPLFGLDLTVSVPDEEYKQLIGDKVRYDRVLWAMIDELSAVTGTRFSQILLFGFSGGAQFAQRLLYVDPERLHAVSLGAPSYVTLPNGDVDWWIGLRDFEVLFGRQPDFGAMRNVKLQLLRGERDNLDFDIYSPGELGMDVAAYSAYGRNRQQRLATLRDAYRDIGLEAEIELVPHAAHAFGPLLEASKPFFERCLKEG